MSSFGSSTMISFPMIIDIGEQRPPRTEDAERIFEFFRLIAILDRKLCSNSKTPFFDVTLLIDPNVEDVDIGLHVQKVSFETLSLAAQRVCRWHLKFKRIAESIRGNLPEPCSPYLPLMALLQSGGRFWIEDIFVDVGDVSIPWTDWRKLGAPGQ